MFILYVGNSTCMENVGSEKKRRKEKDKISLL